MSADALEKQVARAALRAINPTSVRENVEYGVMIYKLRQKLGASEPFTSRMADGLTEEDVLRARNELPRGAKFVAFGHTHGKDVKGEFSLIFSPEDIQMAQRFSVNSYLATPSNELVIFTLAGRPGEFLREPL
jgi:Domain of unknown function (DUF4329)